MIHVTWIIWSISFEYRNNGFSNTVLVDSLKNLKISALNRKYNPINHILIGRIQRWKRLCFIQRDQKTQNGNIRYKMG